MRAVETKQRRTGKLREELNLKAQLLDAATDAIFLYRPDGTLIYVNEAAYKSRGYSKEELMAMNGWELATPELARLFNSQVKEVINEGEATFESVHLCKDGTSMLVETHSRVIKVDSEDLILSVCRNVTKRKQAEEFATTLIHSAQIGVYVVQDGKFEIINPQIMKVLRLNQDQLLGKNALNMVHPEDRAMVRENAIKMLQGKRLEPYEFRVSDSNGNVRVVMEAVAPVTYKGKRAVLGNFMDVTERKQAEELYRILTKSSPGGVYIVQDGKFQFVNPQFQKYTGFSEDELLGRESLELVHPEDQDRVRENAVAMLKGNRPSPYELRYIVKGGETLWATETVTSINYKGRRAVLGNFMDTTEHKQAEEALNLQRAYFQQLFDNSPDAIALAGEGARVVQVNKGFETLFGYRAEEVKGKPIFELIIPEDRMEEVAATNEIVHSGKAVRKETVRRRKDGSLVDVSLLRYPIQFGSELIGTYCIYTDITEHKQAEESLRESQEFSSSLLESSPNPISVINPDLSIRYVNPAFEKLTGFTLAEIAGMKAPYPWWPEGASEKIIAALKDSMKHGGRKSGTQWNFLKKNEERFWVTVKSAPVVQEGKPVYLVINWLDISERKQAEELFKTLSDNLMIGVYIIQDGKFVFANPQFMKDSGFTEDELLGTPSMDSVHPEDRQLVREEASKRLRGEVSSPYEFRTVTKNGETRAVIETIASIQYKGKRAALGSHMDINDRKRAEEMLRQSKEKLQKMFESVTDGILVIDLNGVITEVNQKTLEIHGFASKKDLVGKKAFELVSPRDHERIAANMREAIKQGKVGSIEYTLLKANGAEFPAELSSSVIKNAVGDPAGHITIVRDITERKVMQEQLMLTDRLASIGELASGIAHELNNPLTSVIGFSQLLMEREIADDLKEDLKLVHSEAQRAAGIVKNLLTFARKHAPVKQLTQINSIIEDVLRLRAYEQKVNNIEVIKHYDAALPEIMVDHFLIRQVFLNLVINAEYFMSEAHKKGALTITSKRADNTVTISFTDDGPGISREDLNRIFSPFFTTKEVGKGTGLGLSICHGIVAEHGGNIHAKSQVGKGATFIVELPINSS